MRARQAQQRRIAELEQALQASRRRLAEQDSTTQAARKRAAELQEELENNAGVHSLPQQPLTERHCLLASG